ncbi:MAG: hypothetical protein ACRC14_20495 [Paracoccaceae bacterium]
MRGDIFVFNQIRGNVDLITDFQTGVDKIHDLAQQLDFGPDPGPVDPAIFSIETANGTQLQFILKYIETVDETWLLWDSDRPCCGNYLHLRFAGQVDVAASDILLI